ncbi:hypothetical protein [Paractinoplanes lichenicola]|uniref:Transcriptional regulator n=1 Tax=Paractinoplanes lichenicola TaxID=2802976 RepID=A0ABS1VY18_9ACTN|nr:hypothetical protein [Actinoplanes lichenicola]MBL7259387.1 hypothetical protein [Actinoplanes lichenicola]
MDTVAQQLTRLVGDRLVFIVAARSGVWPGTLQKYLSGEELPADSAPLTAVGTACGADEAQLAELVDAWNRQSRPSADQ